MSELVTNQEHAKSDDSKSLYSAEVSSVFDTPPERMWKRQFGISCLFWVLCLTLTAAGHRLYKATVAVDRLISVERYKTDGAPLVWVGYGSVDNAIKRVIPEGRPVDLDQLSVLPNSPFLLATATLLALAAALMAWLGRWIDSNGIQSLIGVFAGHFLWLGAIEFGLAAVGRRLGLAGSLELVDGRVVGTHGSGILIQMSVVFLVPMLIGLTMHESNRCAVFQWFRRWLPIARTVSASGRIENYAARTTIQYFMTVWFCYVSVLWLADPRLGKVGQIGLLLTSAAIAIATPYMIWRTVCQPTAAQALRYSVSGAVVTWTGIEIAAAMRFFHEPWLSHSISSAIVWFGLSILLTVIVARILLSTKPVIAPSRAGAALVLIAVALGMTGCNQSNKPATLSAKEVEQRLREFDAKIQPPKSSAHDGLLKALGSPDPEMQAQAALAFGKSSRVSPIVEEQLLNMASNEESRLPQFAAIKALHRLDLRSPDLENMVGKLYSTPKWKSVVEYVKK